MKTQKILIAVLSLLIVICLGVTVWALFFRGGSPISPDYPPQGTEENQKPMEGDDSDKLDSADGGGAINVTFGTAATASLSEKKVSLYYANPNVSNRNVAILVMVGEMVVAKSDLITPGHEVTELALEEYAAGSLTEGGYDAVLVVRAYDETGEKAMVDTKGELILTVEP